MADNQNGGFSANGVAGASYNNGGFKLPDGIFKINGGLYQSSQGANPTLNAINPNEAKARFGTVTPIDQVLAQAPETSAADLQKLGIAPPSTMDTATAPNTADYTKYLSDQSKQAVNGAGMAGGAGAGAITSPATVAGSANGLGGTGGSGSDSSGKQGFDKAMANGAPAVPSKTQAADIISQNLPQNSTNPQADVVLKANQAHQQYLNDYAAAQTSFNQTNSLTQEYTTLSQQLGIPALNTQLLNMKNVMDGTEQDIRDEVTKSGGFSTDSQVLALTDARNKVMLKNYNTLLQTRNDMQNNLTTMIGLAEKDRAYASAQIDRQLNFDTQNMTYADKMLTNAQDSLTNNAKTNGWDNVYQSALATGDVQAVDRINSVMGPGFNLQTAAAQAVKDRQQALDKANLDLQKTHSEINKNNAESAKAYSDMKNGGSGSSIDQAVAKQNALQDAADKQTLNSNYTQILAILNKNGITDPSNLSTDQVSKMSNADQISIGKALGRMQNPDIARMGGNAANPLDAVGFFGNIGQGLRQAFTGGLYSSGKVVDAIKTANGLYNERNGISQSTTVVPAAKEGDTKLYNGVNYKVIKGVWTPQH